MKIKNFRSIKQADINFEEKNYLILGNNKDDEGLESNGSGKTHLLDSICWCLFNKSIKKNSIGNDIIRRTKKRVICSVQLDFKHRGNIYRMINRRPGKPSLFINGNEKKKMKIFDYVCNEVLGIDFDTFKKIVILSERDRLSLCGLSDVQIKRLLDNLISNEIIDVIQKAEIENENNLKDTKERIVTIPEKISFLLKDKIKIKTEKEQFEKDSEYNIEIKKIRQEIEEMIRRKFIVKNKLEKLKNLEKIKQDILKKSIKEKEDLVKVQQDFIKKIELEIEIKEKEFDKYNKLILKFIKCPKCGNFINTAKKDLSIIDEIKYDELVKLRDDVEKKIQEKNKELKLLKEQFNKEYEIVNNRVAKFQKLHQSVFLKVEKYIEKYNFIVKLLIEKNNSLKIQKNTKKKMLLMFDKRLKDNLFMRQRLKKDFSFVEKRYELYKFWKFHFGKEGLKNFLYNKKLKLLQQYTNNVLSELGVNFRILFDGFRKLKSGKFKNKVSVQILEKGQIWNYFDRSNGEQLRIDYATILAYRNLLSNRLGYTFDFIGFDELFNGFDDVGKQEICDLIENLKQQFGIRMSLVISHDDTIKNNFENIIQVEKKNGITRVLFGD